MRLNPKLNYATTNKNKALIAAISTIAIISICLSQTEDALAYRHASGYKALSPWHFTKKNSIFHWTHYHERMHNHHSHQSHLTHFNHISHSGHHHKVKYPVLTLDHSQAWQKVKGYHYHEIHYNRLAFLKH